MTIPLRTILEWGPANQIGERLVRSAMPTDAFWELWRAHKASLTAAGISCAMATPRAGGGWRVTWSQAKGGPDVIQTTPTCSHCQPVANTHLLEVTGAEFIRLSERQKRGEVIIFGAAPRPDGGYKVTYKEKSKTNA